MEERAIQKVCRMISYIAILNFLLFFLIAVVIGGGAIWGKIEEGHYYVGNHGRYTEVGRLVFTYSQLHALSLCITHPLGILAGWILRATGGRRVSLKAVTPAVQPPPSNAILNVLYVVRSSLWRVVDSAEGFFWRIYDSWRKPDVEFHTRLSSTECIATLSQAPCVLT
jgi:hypothetical protein